MLEIVPVATALIALLGTVFTGVMAYLMAKLNQKQALAAIKVEAVAVKADAVATKVEAVAVRVEEAASVASDKADAVASKAEVVAAKADVVAAKVDEAAVKVSEVATKVEEVKVTLEASTTLSDAKLDAIARVADATHALVNSNMAAQLKISAIALRRVAEMTSNPKDIAMAELADKNLADHEAQQAVVDSKQ